jgi:AraC-like DNA-binding protein
MTPYVREVFEDTGRLLPEVPACGWSRQRVARRGLVPHSHRGVFELCLIRAGEVEWWAQHETYTVSRGQVFLTKPGEPHGGVGAVVHPCELYWLQVRIGRRRPLPGVSLAATRVLLRDLEGLPNRVISASSELQHAFVAFIEEHRATRPHAAMRARAALHAALALLVRESRTAPARPSSAVIRRATEWIERRLEERFAVGDVAATAGVSAVRLQALFRDQVGCSVGEYRTRLRVGRAKRLLVTERGSITELALALGFASAQHFATVFRRYVGISPGAYRRTAVRGSAAPS